MNSVSYSELWKDRMGCSNSTLFKTWIPYLRFFFMHNLEMKAHAFTCYFYSASIQISFIKKKLHSILSPVFKGFWSYNCSNKLYTSFSITCTVHFWSFGLWQAQQLIKFSSTHIHYVPTLIFTETIFLQSVLMFVSKKYTFVVKERFSCLWTEVLLFFF